MCVRPQPDKYGTRAVTQIILNIYIFFNVTLWVTFAFFLLDGARQWQLLVSLLDLAITVATGSA